MIYCTYRRERNQLESRANEEKKNHHFNVEVNAEIIKRIIGFLQLFICETLAKRLVSMVLIAAGLPNAQVTALTGYCDKCVRTLRKELSCGIDDRLFHVGGGGGKSKLAGLESAILEEIDKNDYNSQQQIADMVEAKYGIKVSVTAIRRLLKKRYYAVKMRFPPSKSGSG
jgi:transposase